jgi:hypothetical protein
MDCEEVRHELAARLAGSADPAQDAAMRDHLLACAECRDEAAALGETWAALDAVPAERADTAAMRARFDAALELYEHGLARPAAPTAWDRVNAWMAGWWPSRPVLQAALAGLFLVAGFAAGMRRVPAATPVPSADGTTLADLRRELHDTREMVMLSLLQQSSAADRLRGVSWSSQIDQPNGQVVDALLDALAHDPNVNVRLACVDALQRFGDNPRVRDGVLQTVGDSSSALVQIALIDFLVERGDRAASPTLRRISEDLSQDEAVRGRAAWAANQLG